MATVLFQCRSSTQLRSMRCRAAPCIAEFAPALSRALRERHLGTSKAGCYVACHARSVRAMCCQTSRVRSQGRHKSRNGPTRRRRSDCMIARERAQRRCVVEGLSRGAGSPVPLSFFWYKRRSGADFNGAPPQARTIDARPTVCTAQQRPQRLVTAFDRY